VASAGHIQICIHSVFTTRCTIVQSAVLRSHVVCLSLSVCLSMTLVDHDHIGWKSWKLIAWTISPTSSLFVAQRSSTYSQGNMEKFWGENVRSTPTSIMSGWIEPTESHVILDGGVAVCCLFTFVGASCGNLCNSTAFLLLAGCLPAAQPMVSKHWRHMNNNIELN